jgi:GTP cyclohydrolase II
VTQPLVNGVDFASYRELLGALLPEGFQFAVTLVDGESCWRDVGFPASIPFELIGQRCAELENTQKRSAKLEPLVLDDASVFSSPVVLENNKPVALLWAATREEGFDINRLKWLDTVAEHIAKEISLNSELDSFARELTERYEELNLVYHTEDRVNYFKEGQDALEQLVANCRDYLDVGLAVLILKEKGVIVVKEAESSRVEGAELLVERIRDGVYDTVRQHNEAIVINDSSNIEAIPAWRGLAYRLIAAPVDDSTGEPVGVLAIASPFGGLKFSNSDRNLVEVMARKASKILQVNYDTLTGLVNREGLEFLAEQLI